MPWLQEQRSGKACFARGDLFISFTLVTNGNRGEYGFFLSFVSAILQCGSDTASPDSTGEGHSLQQNCHPSRSHP